MALWHKKKNKGRKQAEAAPKVRVSAVILAGGSSTRMGGEDKLALTVAGRTVLAWSLRAFQACDFIQEIIVVTHEGGERNAFLSCDGCDKVARVVHGGPNRTASAYQGVMAAAPDAEIILIHDGARPLVTETVIREAVQGAMKYGAALPVIPVTDTIKVSKDGFVDSTPDRSTLFAAQTPQAFRSELIKAALTDAVEKGLELTDDCAAVERLGMRVRLVDGDIRNRKITTPPDLALTEALLKQRLGEEQGA
jgi:2-C-methyl-D-erythritol 4-phosphate cytidylyltransferase